MKENTTLRVIDLEGNNLTNEVKVNDTSSCNTSGIELLAEGIKVNTTLLYLNLYNTCLDKKCGEILREAIEENKTLIQLDIGGNPKMDLMDVRAIQDALKRNKLEYDEERFKEFIERKRMRREQDISSILEAKKEALVVTKELIDQRIDAKRKQLEEEWTLKVSIIIIIFLATRR